MLRRILIGLLVLVAAICGTVLPASAASADTGPGCYFDPDLRRMICPTEIGVPGSEGSAIVGEPGRFTEGPQSCTLGEVEIDCSSEWGWWNQGLQCYIGLAPAQSGPPAGHEPEVGAWYGCMPHWELCSEGTCGFGYYHVFWSDVIPAGVSEYTPAQAARSLAAQLELAPIDLGIAPERKTHDDDPPGTEPYRRTWVGIPVWLWAEEPGAEQLGPTDLSATLGGVSVSIRASVTSLIWRTSDGQSIPCGAGTPFDATANRDVPAIPSPDCGVRFTSTGTHEISATSTWRVEWSGGGQDGEFFVGSLTASDTVQVGELQSVNTTPRR